MLKKELNMLKKEFKTNSASLHIEEIYTVYLKKDNNKIIFSEVAYFDTLDEAKQELYYNSFKKILGGSLDTKLFQLSFQEKYENEYINVFNDILSTESKEDFCDRAMVLVGSMGEYYKYDTDVVITFIRAEYWKGSTLKKSQNASDIIQEESLNSYRFILAGISSIDTPKSSLKFDFETQSLNTSAPLEYVVNIAAPLEGILFPVLSDGYSDVNSLMYYVSKGKLFNEDYLDKVFGCAVPRSAKDELEGFNEILNLVAPGSMTTVAMKIIYEALNEIMMFCEEKEEATVDSKALTKIIIAAELSEPGNMEEIFEEVLGNKYYELKIKNIIPDFDSKSVKIKSAFADISITPADLNTVKQVRDEKGNRCLLIEIDEGASINGLFLNNDLIGK
ncbi:MAG TPA: DUF4317 family protein [Clostridiaceae bacterium]